MLKKIIDILFNITMMFSLFSVVLSIWFGAGMILYTILDYQTGFTTINVIFAALLGGAIGLGVGYIIWQTIKDD